jgi:hypothetical protein
VSSLYILGKILSLPGAFLKAFWEHLVYKILKVPVESNAYLNIDEGLGHVEHDHPSSLLRLFLGNFLPGFLNFLLGLPPFLAGALGIVYLGVGPTVIETGAKAPIFYVYLLAYFIGGAFLCNIFPLLEDSHLLWEKLYSSKSNAGLIAKVLLFVPSALMLVGSYLEQYALNVLFMLVMLLVGIFA